MMQKIASANADGNCRVFLFKLDFSINRGFFERVLNEFLPSMCNHKELYVMVQGGSQSSGESQSENTDDVQFQIRMSQSIADVHRAPLSDLIPLYRVRKGLLIHKHENPPQDSVADFLTRIPGLMTGPILIFMLSQIKAAFSGTNVTTMMDPYFFVSSGVAYGFFLLGQLLIPILERLKKKYLVNELEQRLIRRW